MEQDPEIQQLLAPTGRTHTYQTLILNLMDVFTSFYTRIVHSYFLYSQVRQVSNNILSTGDAGISNDSVYSHMVTLFGQWNDHDLTFTPFSPSIRSFSNGVNCDESCEHTEPCIPIPVSV